MLLLPAIDIRAGQCVRLRQGDYAQETVFGADPAAMAQRWVEQGATYLHLVDLDGARQGKPVNDASVRRIIETARVPCQLGGGIRSEHDLEEALTWGLDRVILGTRALEDPAWVEKMARQYPGRVGLGIDAKNGYVATVGWTDVSSLLAIDLARNCRAWPLAAIVHTDISRDGMLTGPDAVALAELAAVVSLPVIASGGITTLEDISRLAALGLAGCIIGRALYEGRLDLAEAIRSLKDPAAGK